MSGINIEKPVPLLVGEPDWFQIVLVGAGGTGSFLAQDLARLAWHARQRHDTRVQLAFIDPDVVEPDNLGRQNFVPAELGQPKARALAFRYSAGFGLDIAYAVQPFSPGLVQRPDNRGFNLVLGAVDNAPARQV